MMEEVVATAYDTYQLKRDTFYVTYFNWHTAWRAMGNTYLARCLNKRLARVGSTAVSKGSKNPPRWFMSRFLAEEVTRLSATKTSQ